MSFKYYKYILTILVFIVCSFKNYSQNTNFDWAIQLGGIAPDVGEGVTVDALGNVYSTGAFQWTADFDPGGTVYNMTASNQDVYVSKLDVAGKFVWAKQFGGTGGAGLGIKLITDLNGNLYVIGNFGGTVDFDPDTSTFYLTSVYQAAFICKLDTSGKFLWAKQFHGSDIYMESIVLDLEGNIYTTGNFYHTVDFDPGPGIYNLSTNSSTGMAMLDVFVSKLDNSGNFVWAKRIGGNGEDFGGSILLDNNQDVYVSGNFNGLTDFNPDVWVYFPVLSNGSMDHFMCKLDSSGEFVWVKHCGAQGAYTEGFKSVIDTDGFLYTTGRFDGTTDFDPDTGNYNFTSVDMDIFIYKLDSTGNFVWAKQMSGNWVEFPRSIAIDTDRNIYATGEFGSTVDFDPDTGTFNMTPFNSSNLDIYIVKLDVDGNFIWANQIGNTYHDMVNDITVDGWKNVYTTGNFAFTVDFNQTSSVYNLTSAGDWDAFIHKMSQTIINIVDQDNPNYFSFFPNPATASCTFTHNNISAPGILTIYDITGRRYVQQVFNGTAQIDVSNLASGIYIAEVRDKYGNSINGKLVKE